jgi:hypothetical protein
VPGSSRSSLSASMRWCFSAWSFSTATGNPIPLAGWPAALVASSTPVDLFNYVSPSAWINAGIEQATGVDVFGYFTDAVTGEWDAICLMVMFGDGREQLIAGTARLPTSAGAHSPRPDA